MDRALKMFAQSRLSCVAQTVQGYLSDWINLIKAIFVFEVVFGHVAMVAAPKITELYEFGATQILILAFRLLSRFGQQSAYGFVFFSGYFIIPQIINIDQQNFAKAGRRFLFNRLRRIYPTLLFALCCTALIDWVALNKLGGMARYKSVMQYSVYSPNFLHNAVVNLLCLQPTFGQSFGSNGPLWTLGYLIQYYVFGVICRGIWSVRPKLVILPALIVALFAGLNQPEWLMLFATWCTGGALRYVIMPKPVSPVFMLLLALGLFVFANVVPAYVSILLVTISMVIYTVCGAHLGPLKCVERLAGASNSVNAHGYTIYAIHFPVIILSAVLAEYYRLNDMVLVLAMLSTWVVYAISISWDSALTFLLKGGGSK